MFISRPISGKLMDKKGLSAVALPAILVTASSAFLLGRASMFGSLALVAILISAVLRAVGQGAAQPSLQTASILKVGKEHSGVATSTFFLGGDVGQGIGPMIGGVIIGAFTSGIQGYRTMFDLCGVLLIIAFITLFIIQKREKKAK
jgi:MFS family permease